MDCGKLWNIALNARLRPLGAQIMLNEIYNGILS